ncbi:sphingosine phosphate lyase-like, putative [Bodo saltans]|uniref:sphinganine-1-phosphate aldolase n=1 Tax=Bodo saltans TaxID=75058 RepID=A0A0S4JRW4_BODSA|nr:sphingosine phosphate lyase-like, putative [Bodo saltans]|eukprot:CUG93528.1 sphingosine phosphate lyase-like, putative [Bodo saltans]
MSIAAILNGKLSKESPAAIVTKTVIAVLLSQWAIRLLEPGQLWKRFNAAKWTAIRSVFASIVQSKVKQAGGAFKFPALANEKKITTIPLLPISHADVIAEALVLHEGLDVDYHKGGLSGAVYHGGDEHTAFINRIMEIYQWSNPLHVDVFGATRKMEAEVVEMVLRMYNGDARPGSCGALTSGGTESIGLAMKSYRDWGLSRGMEHPSIVAPVTAHPAFDKACAYYQLRLIKVPVGASGQVDPEELAKYIRIDTIAIVGSGPTFPHGTVDPISALSEIAYERGIGLHVDCCLGSFIMPFLEKAGFPGHVVDFRLRGVTTISCDTHKYGFSPKGTSVVMYGSRQLREFQFFANAEWPGGIYASPGASGSKAGNVIAGTWAAMLSIGEQGYIDSCRSIVGARIKMTNAIEALPFLRILGKPSASVFGFTSDTIDVYGLIDEMKARGWSLNPLQFPAGVQFSVTLLQAQEGVAEKFITDICEVGGRLYAEVLKKQAEGQTVQVGSAGASVYGSQQRVSDRTILNEVMKVYLNAYYDTNHQPEEKK